MGHLAVFPLLALAAAAEGQSFADTKTTEAQAAASAAPKPILTAETRGDIAMARKDYRQAVELYKSIAPPTHLSYNKIGIAYHQLTEMDNAARYYARAVKAKRDYAEAINNLGAVYYAQKSYRRAVGQYSRALKYAPKSASIYSNLGTAWFARKNYQKASEAYQKALDLDPEVFEHRGTNGVMLQERSVEERAKFHYYLAKTYAKAGMNERALQYMRRSLEEGFKEKKKFVEEPEFAGLQKLTEFQELLTLNPRVL